MPKQNQPTKIPDPRTNHFLARLDQETYDAPNAFINFEAAVTGRKPNASYGALHGKKPGSGMQGFHLDSANPGQSVGSFFTHVGRDFIYGNWGNPCLDPAFSQ
jgi:hypothetical protein